MMLIDTHCHLTFPEFQKDLSDVISRAVDVGIQRIVVPAISLTTSIAAIDLAEKFDSVFAAVGIHPQDSNEFKPEQIEEFEKLVAHKKVVAVGEIGLDFYRNYAPGFLQKKVFKAFLRLAKKNELPVIIHNRSAYREIIDILTEEMPFESGGVFHCFSESETKQVLEMGFVVSFTGTVTFKNSKSAEVSKKISLENQLLETDAPFMAPVPYRGKRNEPAYVKNIAKKQAELHGVSFETVANVTTDLSLRVFPKLSAG